MRINCTETVQIRDPSVITKIVVDTLNAEDVIDRDKEHVWVVGLNASNIIRYIELSTLGIMDQCLIHPREVFRLAIMSGVYSIIVIHNHPAGTLDPSNEDIGVQRNLAKCATILGIRLHDYIIINTGGGFLSFKEGGYGARL